MTSMSEGFTTIKNETSNWQVVTVAPPARGGSNAFTLKARANARRGRTYSTSTAGRHDATRPGYVNVHVELVDGVVTCTNAQVLLDDLTDVVNAAICDYRTFIAEHGTPPAYRQREKDDGRPQKVVKHQRKLNLTPEQRAARRAVSEAKRAENRARSAQIRTSMKGGAGKGR